MKTIDEAAKEYAKQLDLTIESKMHIQRCDFETTFKDGIQFAQIWISVDEELPENGTIVFTKYENEVDLCWYKNGRFVLKYATIHSALSDTYNFREDITKLVTHWRPIEFK